MLSPCCDTSKERIVPALRGLVAVLLFSTAACDPGRVQIDFIWPDGERPVYPTDVPATTTMRVEYRLDPRKPGRELTPSVSHQFSPPQATIIPEVPYGDHRVIIAEVRSAPGADQIDYYGISEPFTNERGEHVYVPVFMGPTTPPKPRPPTLGPAVVIETSSSAPGTVGDSNVYLRLYAEETADRARVSNIDGLPEGRSVVVKLESLDQLDDAPPGYRGHRMRWNLERWRESLCDGGNYCLRQVNVRFIDPQDYASPPVSASVVLDEAPPYLIDGLTSVAPEVVRNDQHIVVSLTASERVRTPVVYLEGRRTFPFVRVSPSDGALSATYTFRSLQTASVLRADGEFRLRADLEDLAGAKAKSLELGRFSVDTKAPELSDIVVRPARISGAGGGRVTLSFALNKRYDGGRLHVTIGGRPMDRCAETDETANSSAHANSNSAVRISVVCEYLMRGDEVAAGTEKVETLLIKVEDAAGHEVEASAVIHVDFKAPTLYAATITPSAARREDVAQLYVASDEPMAAGYVPVLRWSGNTPPFVHDRSRDSTFERYFTLTVSTRLAEGTYVLAEVVLQDDVGNAGTATSSNTAAAGVLPVRWLVDPIAPEVRNFSLRVENGALVQPPRVPRIAGTHLVLTFSEHEENPASLRVYLGSHDLTPSCTMSGRPPSRDWRCVYVTTAREYEGAIEGAIEGANEAGADGHVEKTEIVGVVVTDAARNEASATAQVVFDYRSPEVAAGSESIDLIPSATNPLTLIPGPPIRLNSVGNETTIYIRFIVSEPLAEVPVLTTRPAGLAFALEHETTTSYTYRHTLTGAASAQGPHEIDVTLRDIAGNIVVQTLRLPEPGLVVDTLPPAAPNTGLITHHRFPWGSEATGDGPHAFIEASAGAVEGNAHVVVLGAPEISDFEVLGHSLADEQGGLNRFTLTGSQDRASVYVAVIDGAGNVSWSTSAQPGQASRVRRGTWTATLRGKIPGTRSPNPHDAIRVRALVETLEQDPTEVQPLDASDFDRLARADGNPLTVTTSRRFEAIPTSDDQPSSRMGAALAYDMMRGRAVLFGGQGIRSDGTPGLLNDTWEFDGHRWYSVRSNTRPPPPRRHAAMAFDPSRGVVVLFGGSSASELDDTWLWDGESWTRDEPAGNDRPAARSGPVIAYDRERGEVVMFGSGTGGAGGGSSNSTTDNTTWRWSETSGWSRHEAASNQTPDAPQEAPLVFERNTLRAFELMPPPGTSEPQIWSLTYSALRLPSQWEWSARPWPAPAPEPRTGAAVVYDPKRNQTVLFGGQSASGFLDDTWLGRQPAMLGENSPRPPARAHACTTFDVLRGEVILFGGENESGLLGDMWSWDGRVWKDITPSVEAPSVRSDHAMAFDPVTRSILLFGGSSQTDPYLGDTWTWNGARWQRIELPQNARPDPRRGHAMTTWSNGVAMFGGEIEADLPGVGNAPISAPKPTAFWLWNGRTWQRKRSFRLVPCENPQPNIPCFDQAVDIDFPDPRQSFGMTFDSIRNEVVIFGGIQSSATTSTLLDTTAWEWQHLRDSDIAREWRPVNATGPSPRSGHAMTFDAIRGRAVLFGGADDTEVVNEQLWEWDGVTWVQPVQNPALEPRQRHAMAFDEARGRVVVYGGQTQSRALLHDSWEWDGDSWTDTSISRDQGPGARAATALAYEPDRRRVVLFGGIGDEIDQSTWELHVDPEQRAGIRISFDFSYAGVPQEDIVSLKAQVLAGGLGATTRLPGRGVSQMGSELGLWNARRGKWEWNASNNSDPARVGPVSAHVNNRAAVRSYVRSKDELLHILIRQLSGVGNGNERPEIAAEGIEFILEYEYAN